MNWRLYNKQRAGSVLERTLLFAMLVSARYRSSWTSYCCEIIDVILLLESSHKRTTITFSWVVSRHSTKGHNVIVIFQPCLSCEFQTNENKILSPVSRTIGNLILCAINRVWVCSNIFLGCFKWIPFLVYFSTIWCLRIACDYFIEQSINMSKMSKDCLYIYKQLLWYL